MSQKDTITKEYTKDARIFADAFNLLIYKGEQIIRPEDLHPLDTTELALPYGPDRKVAATQRLRDGLKYLTVMEDESAIYLMLGLENQSEVHYAMPVRNMLYDALQYAAQVEETAARHREERQREGPEGGEPEQEADVGKNDEALEHRKVKKLKAGEYLSGFYQSDRLVPVITLVLHFDTGTWDGPISLHEMFTVRNPSVLSLVSDYKINIFSPSAMTEAELNSFTTSLREVMLFIKYAKDKTKLKEMLQTDARFQSLDRRAAEVIRTVTGSKIKIEEHEEDVNMCQALQEMVDDATAAGRAEGIATGKAEGMRVLAVRMLNRGKYAVDEIAELTGFTEEEIRSIGQSLIVV